MPLTWKYMSSARKRSMKVATPTEEKAARKPKKDKRRYSDSEKEKKHIFFYPGKSLLRCFLLGYPIASAAPVAPANPAAAAAMGSTPCASASDARMMR